MLPVAPGAVVVLVLAVGVAEADEPKRLPEAEGLEAVAPLWIKSRGLVRGRLKG
jgi:hypothetical protein